MNDADLAALENPLPDDARFEAYYYSFEPTGIGAVDAILSAVAIAGKGSHHTESWGDNAGYAYYNDRPGLVDGETAIDLIQKNADRSADLITQLILEVRELREALGTSKPVKSPDQVDRCSYCGHRPHGPVCFNMASDNDCECRHAQ